jgi:hypothetical protein
MTESFITYIPIDIIITALLNNVAINIFKPFYFMFMANFRTILKRDFLIIIVFVTGGALYSVLSYGGVFPFVASSCILSPVISVLFYEAGFYSWLVRTLRAILEALSARITEVIYAFRKK